LPLLLLLVPQVVNFAAPVYPKISPQSPFCSCLARSDKNVKGGGALNK
jgi:hypothetical protein